jgi:hypothetical protein
LFNKIYSGRKKKAILIEIAFLFLSIFSCCSKRADQPQENLAKAGLKTN